MDIEQAEEASPKGSDQPLVDKLAKCLQAIHAIRKLAKESKVKSKELNGVYGDAMKKTWGMLTEILDQSKRLNDFTTVVKADQKSAEERLGGRVNSIVDELRAFSKAAESEQENAEIDSEEDVDPA